MATSLGRTRPVTNAPFAVLASALLGLADILLLPAIVLVFFVSALGGTNQQLATIFTVGILGWLLPRWLLPWFMSGSTRQMPIALGASLVRAAAVIFLAYVSYRDDLGDEQRLRAFFICFAAYSIASGFAHQPVTELIARASPGDGARAVLRWRDLLTVLLIAAAAAVAPGVFGTAGPEFPRNVALLFIVAAAATAAATFFIARLHEPQSAASATRPLRPGDLGRVARDGAYRRYALFGSLAAAATLADPFYLVYARNELDLPASWIGHLFAAYALALVISGPVWAWLIRAAGSRTALQLSVGLRVLAPLLLLSLPYLIASDLYRDRVGDPSVVFWILLAPFAILGVALRGFISGNAEYVAALTVPARRAAYGVMALLPMAVAAVAPFAGVAVIERWGFERLFVVALFAGLAATIASGLLIDATLRVRRTARAWRLDGARS